MTSVEIAWLAGLLEGEGYFGIKKCKRKSKQGVKVHLYPKVACAMTDHDVVAKAANLLKTRLYGPYNRKTASGKEVWAIHIHYKYAIALMMTILPLMGERRTARILELIEMWKTLPSKFHPGEGEKHHSSILTEKQVREIKSRYANGESQANIGRDLNIWQSTISRIIRNKAWRSVKCVI